MLASRAGRVGGVAVAVAALASAWRIGRRSAPAQPSIAAQAVQAALDGRAGPLCALETRMLPVPDDARDIGTAHPIRVRIQSPQHGDPRNELALGPLRWVAPPVGR